MNLVLPLQFHLSEMKRFSTLLRQLILGAIAAVVVNLLMSSHALASETLHKITGTGLHRPTEEICNQELPVFRARLRKLGYAVQITQCQPVEGEPESYEPKFIAYGRKPAVAETAQAIHFSDTSACDQILGQLIDVVRDDENEKIVEAGCVPLHIINTETGEYGPVQYQPMVILFKQT